MVCGYLGLSAPLLFHSSCCHCRCCVVRTPTGSTRRVPADDDAYTEHATTKTQRNCLAQRSPNSKDSHKLSVTRGRVVDVGHPSEGETFTMFQNPSEPRHGDATAVPSGTNSWSDMRNAAFLFGPSRPSELQLQLLGIVLCPVVTLNDRLRVYNRWSCHENDRAYGQSSLRRQAPFSSPITLCIRRRYLKQRKIKGRHMYELSRGNRPVFASPLTDVRYPNRIAELV